MISALIFAAMGFQYEPNEVVVLGMIHGNFRTAKEYSLDYLKNIVREVDPDFVLTEIPPSSMQDAMKQFKETGKITRGRVLVFPEYTDVIFPLTKEMEFEIIPTAGWTTEMSTYRSKRLQAIQDNPMRMKEWDEYQAAMSKMSGLLRSKGSNNPYWIHTQEYDDAVDVGYLVYNRLFNEELGLGGWDNINAAHYGYIEKFLDAHKNEGLRVLITYGSAHKGWFLKKLRKRDDIKLLDPIPILDAAKKRRA